MVALTTTQCITTTYNNLNGLWLFAVRDADTSELLYLGCERLKTIPTLREFKRHSQGYVPDTLTIELIEPVQDDSTLSALKDELKPRYASAPQRPSQPVRCNETGEVFDNCNQAANAYGINYSYLHYHLKGYSTYKTCKGLTFSYLTE